MVAFETFLDLLEVPASWMGAFFPALVKLSVETASNTQLELNTREQALQVVIPLHLIPMILHTGQWYNGTRRVCRYFILSFARALHQGIVLRVGPLSQTTLMARLHR